MKKVVLFLGAFLVIAVVGVYFSLGSIVKAAVQKGGTHALGVETTLGAASINLFGGDVGLEELAVENPPGFEEEYFLQMRGARVVVPPSSLTGSLVEVELLSLDGFTLDLESKGVGNSNYGVLLENLEKVSGGGTGAEEPGTEPAPKDAGGKKEFLITKILITDVTARVRVEAGGSELADTSLHIERIEIDDIDSEGLTVAELTSLVVREILNAAVKNGGGVLPADLLEDLGGQLEDLEERGKELALEKLEEKLDDDEKELLDAAKGLFGKDEDE